MELSSPIYWSMTHVNSATAFPEPNATCAFHLAQRWLPQVKDNVDQLHRSQNLPNTGVSAWPKTCCVATRGQRSSAGAPRMKVLKAVLCCSIWCCWGDHSAGYCKPARMLFGSAVADLGKSAWLCARATLVHRSNLGRSLGRSTCQGYPPRQQLQPQHQQIRRCVHRALARKIPDGTPWNTDRLAWLHSGGSINCRPLFWGSIQQEYHSVDPDADVGASRYIRLC